MVTRPHIATTFLSIILTLLAVAIIAYAMITGNVGSPF
jgi:heme/copper-type cytochrome/quinol oxidase subunit 4